MSDAPYRVGRSRTGLGLFATASIRKGSLIVEYSGPRIPTKDAHALERQGRNRYIFELNSRWSIDGSGRDNMGRYANHSCVPNTASELVRGKVVLRAIRQIMPDDEITYDYGKEYVTLFFKDGCKCAKCQPSIRHPEVRAERASKDERPGPSPFEARLRRAPQGDGT